MRNKQVQTKYMGLEWRAIQSTKFTKSQRQRCSLELVHHKQKESQLNKGRVTTRRSPWPMGENPSSPGQHWKLV